ncbi:MAG: selenide, water dikinase SelD [Cetobacterium sp.]
MGPEVLSKLLKNLPSVEDKNLIVGFEKSDDAAIYKLTDEIALIQTLDFFTPMTEDPYIFGQIAAANSLSDVYAMGGEPKTAMNIVCFPEKENIEILGEILRGGAEKIAEAGAVLSGGHSIHDPEVKYGLSVTGLIHPDKVLKNYGSKEGDVLIITKPLGTGIISTASKVEIIPEEVKKEWIKIMTTLNKYSAEIIRDYSVSACTDITGFGFLGHAYEMAVASEKTFVLEQELIPYLEIAKTFAKEFYINSMGQKNRNYLNDKVDISSVPFWLQEILLDPQTSGGLLFSLPSNEASEVMDKLNALDIKSSLIGTVDKYNGKYIVVR